MNDDRVIIAETPAGGFSVLILPQIVADGEGWIFPDRGQALEWARSVRGGPVVERARALHAGRST